MDTFLPREIYLIIGIAIFCLIVFLLFFSDHSIEKKKINESQKKISNELGKDSSINLNLAITYSEMNQIDKAKEFLEKIKIDELEDKEKDAYYSIANKFI